MKGYKLCLSLLALFGLSLTVSLALSSTEASAATVYDNTVHLTDSLELSSASSYCTPENVYQDWTNDWSGIFSGGMTDETSSGLGYQWNNGFDEFSRNEYVTAWNDKNFWGVSGATSNNPNNDSFTIWWTTSSSASARFLGNSSYNYLQVDSNDGNTVYSVTVGLDTGYGCRASILPSYSGIGGTPNLVIADNYSAAYTPIYFAYVYINYPSEYQGLTIPDSGPVAVTPNTAVPDMQMNEMQNYVGLFSDKNFFTFDGIPFTCDDGFVPLVVYEIFSTNDPQYDGDHLLVSQYFSASAQFEFQFPVVSEERDYRIVSYYGGCNQFNFTEVAFYDFTIDGNGGLATSPVCSQELFCSLNLPTYGLTQVVLAPLTFIATIPQATCTPLVLPFAIIGDVNLPCMTPIYQSNFGTIILIYQTLITGLFAYYVSIKIFGNIKSLANPKDDQIETVKL